MNFTSTVGWYTFAFIYVILSVQHECDSYSLQTELQCKAFRQLDVLLRASNQRDHDCSNGSFPSKRDRDTNRRRILTYIGSVTATTTSITNSDVWNANALVVPLKSASSISTSNAESKNLDTSSLTTQLFNLDGSLKDTDQIMEAQERTITLPVLTSNAIETTVEAQSWVNGKPSTSSSLPANAKTDVATPSLQYNLPMKWNNDYIDSTNQARACTRITTFWMPYSKSTGSATIASNDVKKKGTKKQSSSTGSLQVSDIVEALPQDSEIRQVLRGADLMGGNVRRRSSRSDSNDQSTNTYSEFDLAVAPTTCSGGENEDLRLGFCPYERIYLVSATIVAGTTNFKSVETDEANNINTSNPDSDSISILIVESSRSEWQRANADLRRVRGSFTVN
jgi:hypothetical protein